MPAPPHSTTAGAVVFNPPKSLILRATSTDWPGYTSLAFYINAICFLASVAHFGTIIALSIKLFHLAHTVSCHNNSVLSTWTESLKLLPLTIINFSNPEERFSLGQNMSPLSLTSITILTPTLSLLLTTLLLLAHLSPRGVTNRIAILTSTALFSLTALSAAFNMFLGPDARTPLPGRFYPSCWTTEWSFASLDADRKDRFGLRVAAEVAACVAVLCSMIYLILAFCASRQNLRNAADNAIILETLYARNDAASVRRLSLGPRTCYACPSPVAASASFPEVTVRMVDEEGRGEDGQRKEQEGVRRDSRQ